ncbi:hypothetical protein JD844_009880 [Phrynosoma platyrhinos]|uniref:Condensin complex subunit 1 N-terminal domain-containing protein n=1 Tax=Phrynosoma platyrhinos TaxID=52577 RepID=A0ABQ7TFM9_PHRPL|nr:hypothetical protein JD844_009880 [Phrynosoma platyrhinos]
MLTFSPFAAFRTVFRTEGALAILQHFDTLYSILHHFRTVDSIVKEDALELMMKAVTSHSSDLTAILNNADLVASLRVLHLNALKMNCYILVRLVEAFEMESGKNNLVGLDSKRKSKKNQAKGFIWEEERQSVLQLLTQLLQLDLHQLWSGLIVEEEFVSLVTGCCYRILENPSIGHQRNQPTRDAAIHLLGVALRRYDHMLSATLKVVQMLQHFEHVAPVFVEAVGVWIKEYGMKSIVGELLREIGQKCPQELARDASGMKGYATFLSELAEQTPSIVLANMSVLLHHLDGESYGMRNAILTAMAEVLLKVLNGEQLEEAARTTRDHFLDTLQAHMCDVNGFVRSRVLQLFTRIVQQKALPLTRFQAVVCLTVGRLQDKSVTVVKNAIQLLAAFLSNNPFSCKLSRRDLQTPLMVQTADAKLLIPPTVPGETCPIGPRKGHRTQLPWLLPPIETEKVSASSESRTLAVEDYRDRNFHSDFSAQDLIYDYTGLSYMPLDPDDIQDLQFDHQY